MQCSACGFECRYDSVFGYWKCQECVAVFGFDRDDPDYDDSDYDAGEAELMEREIIGWLEPVRKALQDG